jgi:hypothetical protein
MTKTNMVATFPVTGNWQACRPERQYEGRFLQYTATEMSWVVDTVTGRHHGFASEDLAKRFARSMCPLDGARAVEVEPYWYVADWGRVLTESVHAYDEPAQMSHTRPAAAAVLGCDLVS